MMSTHDSRGHALGQGRVAAAAAVAAVTLALAIVGCSGTKADDSTTTTVAAGATTTVAGAAAGTTIVTGLQKPSSTPPTGPVPTAPKSATGTSIIQTVPLGGKTQDQYENDLPGLEEKAKASPADLGALQDLAIAQYQTQRYDEAIATYRQMIKVKDEPVYHNNLGNVLRDAGKLSEAIKEYQAAIAADPTLVVAYVNLGTLQFNQDAVDAGTKTLDDGIAKTTGEDQKRLKDVKAALLKPTTTTT